MAETDRLEPPRELYSRDEVLLVKRFLSMVTLISLSRAAIASVAAACLSSDWAITRSSVSMVVLFAAMGVLLTYKWL
jgi:hypothetical protein